MGGFDRAAQNRGWQTGRQDKARQGEPGQAPGSPPSSSATGRLAPCRTPQEGCFHLARQRLARLRFNNRQALNVVFGPHDETMPRTFERVHRVRRCGHGTRPAISDCLSSGMSSGRLVLQHAAKQTTIGSPGGCVVAWSCYAGGGGGATNAFAAARLQAAVAGTYSVNFSRCVQLGWHGVPRKSCRHV